MISTKNICLNPTFKSPFLWVAGCVIALMACQKDPVPVQFDVDFFAVKSVNAEQFTSESFFNEPIYLRLNVYEEIQDGISLTTAENLAGTPLLLCDKDILVDGDTINTGIDLFEHGFAELQTITANGANGTYNSHYLVTFDLRNENTFYQNNTGVFSFTISTDTQRGIYVEEITSILIQP